MSFQSSTNEQKWSIYPTLQCDNPQCHAWNDNPTPDTKCFKCRAILPTWAGYLNNNSCGDILEESQYYPPPPLERTSYKTCWNADEIDQPQHSLSLERSMTCVMNDDPLKCAPLKLKRTDGEAMQEEDQHITNAELVIKYIMSTCNLDRKDALNRLDEMTRM